MYLRETRGKGGGWRVDGHLRAAVAVLGEQTTEWRPRMDEASPCASGEEDKWVEEAMIGEALHLILDTWEARVEGGGNKS